MVLGWQVLPQLKKESEALTWELCGLTHSWDVGLQAPVSDSLCHWVALGRVVSTLYS